MLIIIILIIILIMILIIFNNLKIIIIIIIFAQSWRYKPGQYIAGASGCGLPALPHAGFINGPSFSSARPSPSLHFRSARSRIDLDSPVTSEQAASRRPRHRQTSTGTSPSHCTRPKRPTGTWHAPSAPIHQAGPVLSLARERVQPGVTAALPLTPAAASHWLVGPRGRGMRVKNNNNNNNNFFIHYISHKCHMNYEILISSK